MAVWLPWPEQPHSVSQNWPMKLPLQVQESAEQELASRAASMLPVRLPCAPQSGMGHSVSQNGPMKLPSQVQEPAAQCLPPVSYTHLTLPTISSV